MKIRLLASSDVHGYVMPYRYSDNKACDHGFAKLKATMDKYTTEHTLKIDNGDLLEGSPILANYYRLGNRDSYYMSGMMNLAEFDYFNLGNHDFNMGQEVLMDYLQNVHGIFLAGNIKYNGELLGNEYVIHQFDETHKIALIGAVTHYLVNWEKPQNLVGIEVEDAFEFVKRTVAKVKEQEDVNGIVVVYHGGFEKDLNDGHPTEEETGENQGYRMCKEIEGIDVLISGHQHRSFAQVCLNTHTTQTAYNAGEIALIDWDLDSHEIHEEIIKCTEDADEGILEFVKELEDNTQKWLDEPLGEVMDTDLSVKNEFEARLHKHPVITFINTVQRKAGNADLSGNALFNGAVGFNKKITMRDVVSTYVYPNTVVVYKITGKILKEYLEKNAEYFSVIDDEIQVTPSYAYPKPQHYNYDMVDGLDYTLKISNPVGSRVIEMKKDGKDILPEDTFTLALSNYRASGGGNFFMFKGCEIVKDIQEDMVSLISNYIMESPELYINHQENIKVIK